MIEHGGRVTVQYELSQEWDRPKPATTELSAADRRKFYDTEEDARRRKETFVRDSLRRTYPTASVLSMRISGRVATVVLEFRPAKPRLA